MQSIVEVTATEPTLAVLRKPGRIKHVRFVSSPSSGEAVRRMVVARLADFEKWPGELQRFAASASGFAAPLVLMAPGRTPPSASGLQLLALLASKFGSGRGDPYVSPTVAVARRIFTAHSLGAEKALVASAAIEGGVLSVWSCEPRLYRCPVLEIPALAAVDPKALANLQVSPSGSRIHWPELGVDLDLEALREFTDPIARKRAESRYRADATGYGSAIHELRESAGLRQGWIAGLSEREVRRLEKGEVLPHSDTLKKLADAHGWSLTAYMARLAAASKKAKQPR